MANIVTFSIIRWESGFLIVLFLSPVWLKYVDNIFNAWNHGQNCLISFHSNANTLDHNIKSTLETEINSSLFFLYVQLIKDYNTLKRTGYRKVARLTQLSLLTPQYRLATRWLSLTLLLSVHVSSVLKIPSNMNLTLLWISHGPWISRSLHPHDH